MFTGCGTALVTPFRKDQSLDEDALRRLVRRQIDAGINFLVPCGTTGESPTLTHEEQRRVVEITIEEARPKKVPGAGRRGRIQHRGSDRARAGMAGAGRERNSFRQPVLQQAHAGRALPALQGDCGCDFAADYSLQHSGAHRRQHRAGRR